MATVQADSTTTTVEEANDKAVDTSRLAPMIIEHMNRQYQYATGRTKCNKQGGLYPGRVPYIVDVRVLWFAAVGAYIAKDLNRNPHYQLPNEAMPQFELDCKSAGLTVHKFSPEASWKSDSALAVANCVKGKNQQLESLIDELREPTVRVSHR